MLKPDLEGIVTLVMSVLAGGLGVASYTFTHFQSQEDAQRAQDQIERRLERIESKLDKLAERR
jgi:hypothetical protein